MSDAPERIWIEDEFGDGDDDQWTYGSWDVRNYRGYVVEYVRADLALPAVQPDLTDPTVVHANILRGTIAKPTLEQIMHLYGDAVQIKMTMQDEAEAQLRWIAAVQPDAALLEAACIAAHEAYEAAAHEAGWVTNTQSRKPWAEVPEANKIAMRAGIGAALALINKPALPAVQPGKEVMPDGTSKVWNHDAAPASTDNAGGGATREEVAEALWRADASDRIRALQASNMRLSGMCHDLTSKLLRLQAQVRFLERKAVESAKKA